MRSKCKNLKIVARFGVDLSTDEYLPMQITVRHELKLVSCYSETIGECDEIRSLRVTISKMYRSTKVSRFHRNSASVHALTDRYIFERIHDRETRNFVLVSRGRVSIVIRLQSRVRMALACATVRDHSSLWLFGDRRQAELAILETIGARSCRNLSCSCGSTLVAVSSNNKADCPIQSREGTKSHCLLVNSIFPHPRMCLASS